MKEVIRTSRDATDTSDADLLIDLFHLRDDDGNTYHTFCYQSGPSTWTADWSNGMERVNGDPPHDVEDKPQR